MTVDFWTGSALGEPDAADVLACLLSDVRGVEDARSFEDWASDLGFDPDSRTAEKCFRVCLRLSPKVRRFMGDLYDTACGLEH